MNLTYRENVKKTPAITRCVEMMDKYFDGCPSQITSGLRTPIDQLTIILKKMAEYKLDENFLEIKKCLGSGVEHTVHIEELNRDLYWWQRAWSKLLNVGYIVNPPVPAEVLFDYVDDGRNKKGEVIQMSPHQRGLALDIGGGSDLLEKAKRVLKAKESGECFIKSFRIESKNNAVHVDTVQIG